VPIIFKHGGIAAPLCVMLAKVAHVERGRARSLIRIAALAALTYATPSYGYSVLSHEANVDALWKTHIRPLIRDRFPRASGEALDRARAYAYGGAVIQDLGYYPFGSHFFSNLLHYVRSGDFVEALVADARDPNEYAFAMGALAHYAADNAGHPEAINRAVPIMYPKLRMKFGDRVTYEQSPKSHILVEFSFDVVQVAAGVYAPASYHEFIGFEVAKPLLERTFRKIYGLEMKDVFFDEDLAIGTYRFAVSEMIPNATKVAWRDKRDDIEKVTPGVTRQKFVFAMSRRDYEREFGKKYQRPGVFVRVLTFLYKLVPKIGPFKYFSFKPPTPAAEAMFLESFKDARERYRQSLEALTAGKLALPNTNFDVGRPTRRGEYALADETYAELVDKLEKHQFAGASAPLRADIDRYYGGSPARRRP
jgi:Zinc dependent phospholipase C